MISILIPNFNYSVQDLVENLQSQLQKLNMDWEIRILDDASTQKEIQKANLDFISVLNDERIRYDVNPKNVGNGETRNLLAKEAKYEWLLFLDTDMIPVHQNFIANYKNEIEKNEYQVISGGILYAKSWKKKYPLKYLHGKTEMYRKPLPSDDYLLFRGSNFIVHSQVFQKVQFQSFIHRYGYIDSIFGMRLKMQKISFQAMDNPAYHEDKVSSNELIAKKIQSLDNLAHLYKNEKKWVEDFKIVKIYERLQNWGLNSLIGNLTWRFEPLIFKNLNSKNPSFYVLQLFQLGYFIRAVNRIQNLKD